ncbi:hypothetical protein O181_075987 [Austropuccinia psidii MF-1]|uniref:Uncharacterized protein n=1 Tax=Austropuccinia psidii MF-1 TaxID=1389203 RepID=A0A9Q3FDJ7_9BASI|nr:hypothetical protein [Austropuccinia psidii MF-1]
MEGAAPSRKEGRGPRRTNLKVPGEDDEEEEENSVEEEESDCTEGAPAPVGAPQDTGRPTLAQSVHPESHQSEPSLLAIMQQMTQIMANLQADSSSESSSPPAFKTPSMKAPECFDGTQPFKVRSFIQSCQLIFHNDLANFSQDKKNIIIDSVATNSFIAKQFVHKDYLIMSELPGKIPLIILDSSESPPLFLTHHTKYMVDLPSFPSFECDYLVIDTPKEEDVILGFHFLNKFSPFIDWRKGLITFNADQKDYPDPSDSFSNEFSSAKSCAALVGDSRTPSFPSSVHIPSHNSHQSLLSSRDEVFTEIQDVGEDNSVSSLHLFLGIWTFLLHLIMTPWRSCGMKRKSRKK